MFIYTSLEIIQLKISPTNMSELDGVVSEPKSDILIIFLHSKFK